MKALHIRGWTLEAWLDDAVGQALQESLEGAFGTLAFYELRAKGDQDGPDRLTQGPEGLQLSLRGQMPLRDFAHRTAADLVLVFGSDDPAFPALEAVEDLSSDRQPGVLGQVSRQGKVRLVTGERFDAIQEKAALVAALQDKGIACVAGIECGKCEPGSCGAMTEAILQGDRVEADCVALEGDVTMAFDGQPVGLIAFVERIVAGVVEGLAKEMKGYNNPKTIDVTIRRRP